MEAGNYVKMRYLDASAIVKLVIDEVGSSEIRDHFNKNTGFCATSVCVIEALNVIKSKWNYGHISEEQYFRSARKLVLDSWSGKIEIDNTEIFEPKTLQDVEILAKKYTLDLSDALQLEAILRGKYSFFGPESSSVLITADKGLAAAARKENIRVWNCRNEPKPNWA